LGISREAVELHYATEIIDLDIETFVWVRLFGYDLLKRHGRGPTGARFCGQVDLPRALEAGLSGATWVVATNPLPNADEREDILTKNLRRLTGLLGQASDQVSVVRNVREYRAARAQGKHAAFIGIQGGNALGRGAQVLDAFPELVLRVTLLHLTNSELGTTSSPLQLGRDDGLTPRGRELAEALEARRVLLDLAHISKRGFWDVVRSHDRNLPLIVTHTGVSGVHEHWRNLDDAQLRAVADSGGTVGVMYESGFLGDSRLTGKASRIVDHLEHIVNTVGEDHASLGSDWDGNIITPREMPTCLELPILTQRLLERGFSPERIQKIYAGNFLRVVEHARG
jgi:membrane dipeptidase